MDEVMNKVDEIIELLKKDEQIVKMKLLKNEIKSDPLVYSLIFEFKNKKGIDEKLKLFNNPIVKEYIEIQNMLDYKIMYFNNKLKNLINNRSCN